MDNNTDNYKLYKEKVIKASFKAVDELLKVIEEEIIVDVDFDDDDVKKAMEQSALSADKLKNAAQAKKQSIFDSFDILDRVKAEEEKLNVSESQSESKEEKKHGKVPFAEKYARRE